MLRELDLTRKQEQYSSSRRFDVGEIMNLYRGGKSIEFTVVHREDGTQFGSWKFNYIIEPVKQ